MLETDLTLALHAAFSPPVVEGLRFARGPAGGGAGARGRRLASRVQLARRFHNDAVTRRPRVRRKLVVRLFRLAGHAELPRTVEIDDDLPAADRD